MRDCVIAGNSVDVRGGAIVLAGGNATLLNCTLTENTVLEESPLQPVRASIDVGFYGHESRLSLYDCILWNSANGAEVSSDLTDKVEITYSCVRGGYEGLGNFDADPLFVSGPLGDYYLSQRAAGQAEDSPCVDAGSMSAYNAALADKTTRTDGVPDSGTVDIGYHYPTLFMLPEVWVSTPSDTYRHGETLEIVFEAINPNLYSYPVDFYAGIITADGVIWTIDADWSWSASLNPWFASLELPANFMFGPATLLSCDLPSTEPSISDPGTYWVAAAFTHIGTTEFIGEPSVSPFELLNN